MILLGESVAVAHLPWAVKHDLDSDVKRRLQRALLQLNQTDSGKKILESARLTGFAAANDSNYDLSRRIIHEVLNERY
jgi:ABC-type phosphate/phosphonate transport system substrate-binding protein